MITTPDRTYDCAWCRLPDGRVDALSRGRWPLGCPAPSDDPDRTSACLDIRAMRHAADDHRRCEPSDCEWAAQWLGRVSELAVTACSEGRRAFAVVSTVDGPDPVLVGLHDRLSTAKPHRYRYAQRKVSGNLRQHGLVCVVTHDGFIV